MISRYLVITADLLKMYLRQVTHTYIIRKEDTVSMIPEYRFPLKRKCGFLHIGTPVSNLRNWGVKPPGILIWICGQPSFVQVVVYYLLLTALLLGISWVSREENVEKPLAVLWLSLIHI